MKLIGSQRTTVGDKIKNFFGVRNFFNLTTEIDLTLHEIKKIPLLLNLAVFKLEGATTIEPSKDNNSVI